MRRLGVVVLLLFLTAAAVAAAPVSEEQVTALARQLRCVVCQNLSVADSPSEMARQMRDLIRERLAQGESPAEVVAYFVERYGEWVLLAPRPRGFNLLVWLAPGAALLVGFAVVLRMAFGWSRRRSEPAEAPSPEERARVRAELERLVE